MDEIRQLLKSVRTVSKTNPVTYLQLSEMIRTLYRGKPGLYDEKYNPDSTLWLRNSISADIDFGLALGLDHEVNGNQAAAIGVGAVARAYRELLLGSYAADLPGSATTWNAADRLLAVGNGTDTGNRRDALTVYKSGYTQLNNSLRISAYSWGENLAEAGALQYSGGNFEAYKLAKWNRIALTASDLVHKDLLYYDSANERLARTGFTYDAVALTANHYTKTEADARYSQLGHTHAYLSDSDARIANWNTAYTERNRWDGGSAGLVAATGRASLGLVIGTDVLAYRTFGTAANSNTGDFILNQNIYNQVANLWIDSGIFNSLKINGNNYPSLSFFASSNSTTRILYYDAIGDKILYRYNGINDGEMWHSGNFNPSNYLPLSGGTMSNTTLVGNLNADLLDGLHKTDFPYYRYRLISSDGTSANEVGSYQTFNYGTGGSGVTGPLISFGGLDGGNYPAQITADYGTGNVLRFRTRNGDSGTWNSWRTIYHEGNLQTLWNYNAPIHDGFGNDANLYTSTGFWGYQGGNIAGGSTGVPPGTEYNYGSFVVFNSGSFTTQLLSIDGGGDSYIRTKYNPANFSDVPWRKIWTDRNLTGSLTTNYIPMWDGSKLVNGVVTTDGSKIAMGAISLQERLNIAGNIKMESEAPYIELRNSNWALSSYIQAGVNFNGNTLGDYLSILLPSGKNISFSIATAPTALLEILSSGGVKIPGLSGSGTRLVSAQPDGTLVANSFLRVINPDLPQTGYIYYGDGTQDRWIGYDGTSFVLKAVTGIHYLWHSGNFDPNLKANKNGDSSEQFHSSNFWAAGSVTATGILTGASVALGTTGWTFEVMSGKFVVKYNGTALMSVDQSGNVRAAAEFYRGGV